MRVLFTFAGGSGHADPLLPIAEAASTAGHTVAFSGHRSGVANAEARGFAILAPAERTEPTEGAATIAPLGALDMDHEYQVLRRFYAGSEARERAELIGDVLGMWRPDVLVCDEVDFGAMIAAEGTGLPHATVLVTATGSFVRPDVIAEPLARLRAEYDLPPDPDVTMPSRYLVISPFPPSFHDPGDPLPANAISVRPEPIAAPPPHDTDRWWPDPPDRSERPAVYLTLGTVFNTESGDLFQRAIDGLRDLLIDLVVTVGRDLDPDAFGAQPPNVRIERYIPQAVLLPRCDLVVNHGGSGSVVGALAFGVPMVVLPMGADQSLNAARCEQLGVAIVLDPTRATPAWIGEAATRALAEPAFRAAAERIRDEIAALPGPEATVPLLEELASR